MSARRYDETLRAEAVDQVIRHGHSITEVSERLGMSTRSLYAWLRQDGHGSAGRKRLWLDLEQENARLRAELARLAEERDIFRDAAAQFAKAAAQGRR